MRVDSRPLLPTPAGKAVAVDGVLPAIARQGVLFDAVLKRREVIARRSLRGEVERFGSTEGISPELFGSTRSVKILEYLLTEILPGLDMEPEIKTLAEDLILEEVQMRQSLEQQRAEVQT
ncbi:hypothetical protein [Pseudomonas sp. LB1P83]